MIARVWRGRTRLADGDAYQAFLRRTAPSDYGDVEGNRGWVLLRRDTAEAAELTFVSFWESMEAARRYAGTDAERPKYYPEDRVFLLELPERAELHDLVGADLDWWGATQSK
jgi:heme-degrading monooxygenase HmoA